MFRHGEMHLLCKVWERSARQKCAGGEKDISNRHGGHSHWGVLCCGCTSKLLHKLDGGGAPIPHQNCPETIQGSHTRVPFIYLILVLIALNNCLCFRLFFSAVCCESLNEWHCALITTSRHSYNLCGAMRIYPKSNNYRIPSNPISISNQKKKKSKSKSPSRAKRSVWHFLPFIFFFRCALFYDYNNMFFMISRCAYHFGNKCLEQR